jgi:hypothetical protein
MFRLKLTVALAGLTLALAANAQPPMTPPAPGSDAKAGAPAVVVVPTAEVEGKQLERMILDPTDATKTKLVKDTDAHYTFKLKNAVVLAEKLTVLKGSMLAAPRFVTDQIAPKQLPALENPKTKERKLLVETKVDELLEVEDDTIVLLPGTTLGAMTVIKANVAKFKIVAPVVVSPTVELPTGPVVPKGYPLAPENTTDELGKLTKDRDALAAKVKALEAKTAESPALPPLSGQKEFVDLKKDVEDLKAGHAALKKTVEDLKTALAEREKEVNKKLDEALAAATGKADQSKLNEVSALLAELGNLKTLKDNADKVPGLESKVKELAKAPATTTPTTTGDTWIQKCYTGGTVPGRIQENGNWYRFHSHASGSNYWYIKE